MRPFVFLWIPRTGGTSVYQFCRDHYGMEKRKTFEDALSYNGTEASRPVTFGHLATQAVPAEIWHLPHVTVVREPVERACSLYGYWRKRGRTMKSFSLFIEHVYRRGRESIGRYNSSGLSQWNQQSDWIESAQKAGVRELTLVSNDYIGLGLSAFLQGIHVRPYTEPMAHITTGVNSAREYWPDTITPGTYKLIEKLYDKDFQLWEDVQRTEITL